MKGFYLFKVSESMQLKREQAAFSSAFVGLLRCARNDNVDLMNQALP